MLQCYFIRPTTIDRIRASWIGEPIEQYVTWLNKRDYAARNVFRRVPILVRFGEFAKSRRAIDWSELPDHVEPFVNYWLDERGKRNVGEQGRRTAAVADFGKIHVSGFLAWLSWRIRSTARLLKS